MLQLRPLAAKEKTFLNKILKIQIQSMSCGQSKIAILPSSLALMFFRIEVAILQLEK